jgi:hypothetical protein
LSKVNREAHTSRGQKKPPEGGFREGVWEGFKKE